MKVDLDHADCKAAVKAMKARKHRVANATAAFKAGLFDQALADYAAAIEALPGHCLHTALMRLQRCRCMLYLNRPADAKDECLEALRLDPELKDAELLARDAVSIANDYQTWCEEEVKRRAAAEKKRKADEEKRRKAEEERRVEEERKKAKEEAEKAGKEYVDPHPEPNGTNTTDAAHRLPRDWDEEGRIRRATICEGHYFRLNMSSFKTRQRRCGLPTLRHNRTRCAKLRGCTWQPEARASPAPPVEEDDAAAESGNESVWSAADAAWLKAKVEEDGWDEDVRGDCAPKAVTVSDVKRSYRRLAMKWHPDKKARPWAKTRAEKVFQNLVVSYEFMADEGQLNICNGGDTRRQQQNQHQNQQQKQQQNEQGKKEQEQQRKPPPEEPPKAKPQAGRSQAEPPKQDPPTYASMDWNVRTNIGGLLPDPEWTTPEQPGMPPGGARRGIRYSFSMQFTPMTGGRQAGKMLSMVDLDAFGHPERLVHWQSAAWGARTGLPIAGRSRGGPSPGSRTMR